jgi:type III pantothenate kinase
MLLAIDVGNTNITFGVFDADCLASIFRLTTKTDRTIDEFGVAIRNVLISNGIALDSISDAIISSVVPRVTLHLSNAVEKYLACVPLVIDSVMRTGINLVTSNPREIGSDRIVDASAAFHLYGGPVLVLDFGTATTYDLITEDGSFIAGVTAPGIAICADALWNQTAKLPEVSIEMPGSILAKDTVTSMQAGLMYGAIGQTEYIVRKMKDESGLLHAKVVATGGLGYIVASNTDVIDIFDADLTLKGLKIIFYKQKDLGNRDQGAE